MNEAGKPAEPRPEPPATIRRCTSCGKRLGDAYMEGASYIRIRCGRCGAINELRAA